MNAAHIGIFKETNEVSFRGFLEGKDSRGLELNILLDFLGVALDKSLEGKLPDEEVG